MQQRINGRGEKKREKRENLCSRVPNTLVTLTHPYLLVTFRLKAFHFWPLASFLAIDFAFD
jgi:hypothetical protein